MKTTRLRHSKLIAPVCSALNSNQEILFEENKMNPNPKDATSH